MVMKELHKLALAINYSDCFRYSHYVVRAFYDRHEKKRYMGIWRNGADNISVYFNVDGLNEVEISDLLHDKLLDLNTVNKWR